MIVVAPALHHPPTSSSAVISLIAPLAPLDAEGTEQTFASPG
jgi:hypothetical protein